MLKLSALLPIHCNDRAISIKTEKRFLKDLKDFDAAYLWPGLSLDTVTSVNKQSKPIFWERVNTCQRQAKSIFLAKTLE